MAKYQQEGEFNKKKVVPIVILVVIVILLLIFWSSMTVNIKGGHAGVLFRQFGGGIDKERTFGEGFHFIAPWNDMHIYEVRQQEISETMGVLSANGLEIKVDVSVWYKPEWKNLGVLHAEIGEDYLNRIIIPSIRSSLRSVIGKYTPEQLYSTKRDSVQVGTFNLLTDLLDDKYVQINEVLIRSVVLPTKIKEAIERKLRQEQESLEYEFKLTKQKKEAERQRIEAEGKAKANNIINKSLTNKILREKGIEATKKLSESNNAKIVVIGNSEDGLPIILGGSK
jgi:regulator of protease activity HflC (stomatin/prohibitin superfamily)